MNMVMFRRRLASRFKDTGTGTGTGGMTEGELPEVTKYFTCSSAQKFRAGMEYVWVYGGI